MKIFIDDERIPPRGIEGDWVIVREPQAALGVLQANCAYITHISFDNDLGYETEGRDIMAQIFGTPEVQPLPFPRLVEISVHSANIVANQAMLELARSAQKSGTLRSEVIIENRSALYEQYQTIQSWYDDAYENEKDRLKALEEEE